MILHIQKVAGISGSEAHLLSLLPGLRERGWDVRMLMLHEDEPGAWDFARALEARGVPLDAIRVRAPGSQTASHASTDPQSCASTCTGLPGLTASITANRSLARAGSR